MLQTPLAICWESCTSWLPGRTQVSRSGHDCLPYMRSTSRITISCVPYRKAQKHTLCIACTIFSINKVNVILQMALFAGRRSTDRKFLLLQNLLCAKHLPNYMGTSSVYAITLIDRVARHTGMCSPEQRHSLTGALLSALCATNWKLPVSGHSLFYIPSIRLGCLDALQAAWWGRMRTS